MRGGIYFHSHFVFHDGEVGEKFIVLLNSPKDREPFLFIKTTSNSNRKPNSYGCHIGRKVFFLPAGKFFFPKDTWLQLHEVYEFSGVAIVKDGLQKVMEYRAKSPLQMINEISNCMIKSSSDDLTPDQVQFLKRR